MKVVLLCSIASFLSFHLSQAQGVIINEMSQGPNGQKEFIELLVVGSEDQPTGTVDISDWIIDDNSGAFETAGGLRPGLTAGHFRFTVNDTTQNMPIGALMVIYNVADKNPNWDFVALDDDGNDIAHIDDAGMTYYIPGTSTLLRSVANFPSAASDSYTYSSSTIPPTAANWSGRIGFANGGDAIQIRQPDGTFYQGFGISTSTSTDTFTTLPAFTEGALSSFNANKGSGAARVIYLDCGSWYFAGNYTAGTATTDAGTTAETPGAANNANNEDLVESIASGDFNYAGLTTDLPCPEILPIQLISFKAVPREHSVLLQWETAKEEDNDYFMVEKSSNQRQWSTVGSLKAAGNASAINSYQLTDGQPYTGQSFYRLNQVDFDGSKHFSGIAMVRLEAGQDELMLYPNPVGDILTIDNAGQVRNFERMVVRDITGRLVYENSNPVVPLQLNTKQWRSGTYFVSLWDATGSHHFKITRR